MPLSKGERRLILILSISKKMSAFTVFATKINDSREKEKYTKTSKTKEASNGKKQMEEISKFCFFFLLVEHFIDSIIRQHDKSV